MLRADSRGLLLFQGHCNNPEEGDRVAEFLVEVMGRYKLNQLWL